MTTAGYSRPHSFHTLHYNLVQAWKPHMIIMDFVAPEMITPLLNSQAPARLRDFALCWMFLSLASTGFLEQLKMPTDDHYQPNVCQVPATRC